MTRALLALLVAAGPPPPAKPAAPARVDAPTTPGALTPLKPLSPTKPATDAGVGTPCGACHGTGSWTEVRFNHAPTGFTLLGAHAATGCRDCHAQDFQAALPRACSGCHRDVHAGELGARCDGCHEPDTWRSRFDAEAHRRTNFPLLGGHAALPCTECHFEARERRFSRAMVECGACHERDYQRTAGTGVDHAALAFDSQRCRDCHGSFRFKPALYTTHDVCFPITSGDHAGIPCASCHTSLPPVTQPGTCSTRTAACTACHEHQCSVAGGATPTDQQHAQVPGYQCSSTKCYECHRLGEEGP